MTARWYDKVELIHLFIHESINCKTYRIISRTRLASQEDERGVFANKTYTTPSITSHQQIRAPPSFSANSQSTQSTQRHSVQFTQRMEHRDQRMSARLPICKEDQDWICSDLKRGTRAWIDAHLMFLQEHRHMNIDMNFLLLAKADAITVTAITIPLLHVILYSVCRLLGDL